MTHIGYLRYFLQYTPFVALRSAQLAPLTTCLAATPSAAHHLLLSLRYSFFFKKTTLLDLGGYEVPQAAGDEVSGGAILWYLLGGLRGTRYFIFVLGALGSYPPSIEGLFRNARWLEREAAEFFGFFFTHKCDRRALFTIPLFYNFPFRRKYPTAGFFEIFFCPLLRKLRFKHLSFQA